MRIIGIVVAVVCVALSACVSHQETIPEIQGRAPGKS